MSSLPEPAAASTAPVSRWRRWGRALLQGCFGVSWVGTIGAVVVCLSVYAAVAVLLTPARFVAGPGRFMSDRLDDYPFVKAAALRIQARRPSRHEYRVVLIGDSGFREALTSVRDLRNRVSAKTGRPVEITPLTAGGLTELDAVDMCGMLRGHMHGRVLLEVSPYWMAKEMDAPLFGRVENRLGIDSPDFVEEYTHAALPPPRWSDTFAVRNWKFLLSRSDAFLRGLRPYSEPPLHDGHLAGLVPDKVFANDAKRIRNATHGIAHRAAAVMALYERLIARLQAAGIEVTLVEAPINPRLCGTAPTFPLNDRVRRVYLHDCRKLCQLTHASHWDLNADARLTADDFHDAYHINRPAARARFTDVLSAQIAKAARRARTHA